MKMNINLAQQIFCSVCRNCVQMKYYEHHVALHQGYSTYKCGFDNCHSEFQTERFLDRHFEFKHRGVKKMYALNGLTKFQTIRRALFVENALTDARKQALNRELMQEERMTWLEVSTELLQPDGFDIEKSIEVAVERAIDIAVERTFDVAVEKAIEVAAENSIAVEEEFSGFKPDEVELSGVKSLAKEPSTSKLLSRGGRFADCMKCSTPVLWSHRKHHVRRHVDEENLHSRLFYCLLCPTSNPCQSNYLECMLRHVRLVHRKSAVVRNEHYAQNVRAPEIIEDLVTRCFSGVVTYIKQPVVGAAANVPKICLVKCRKCRKMVTSGKQKEHVYEHVADECDITRLFKCLFCTTDFAFQTLRFSALKNHLQGVHQIAQPSAGKNYVLGRQAISAVRFESLLNQCFGPPTGVATTVSICKQGPPVFKPIKQRKRQRKKFSSKMSAKKKIMTKAKGNQAKAYENCRECNKWIRNNPECFKSHSLNHLRDEGIIRFLYQCLECTKEMNASAYTTVSNANMRHHLRHFHKIKRPLNGEHFTDETSKYRDVIIAAAMKNFNYVNKKSEHWSVKHSAV